MSVTLPTTVTPLGMVNSACVTYGVTFSAGLAAAGMIPLTAIYSTFLQRAIDQIIHDVAVQNLHVVFCLDRAGLVGEDGAPQHGAFDITFLRMIPGMVVMQAKDGTEMRDMLWTAVEYGRGPIAIRYPRANIPEAALPEGEPTIIPIGESEQVRSGHEIAILIYNQSFKACSERVRDRKQISELGEIYAGL